MTFRFLLPGGDRFWLHAPSERDARAEFQRIRPGVLVLTVEVIDTYTPALDVVNGPDGHSHEAA